MSTAYILMAIWFPSNAMSTPIVINQEFFSLESCEVARSAILGSQKVGWRVLGVQGCFRK